MPGEHINPDSSREKGREAIFEMCRKGVTLYLQTLDTFFESQGHTSDAYQRRAGKDGEGIDMLARDIYKDNIRLGSPASVHTKLKLVMMADDFDDPRSYAFQLFPNTQDSPEIRDWEKHIATVFREHDLPYAEYPW